MHLRVGLCPLKFSLFQTALFLSVSCSLLAYLGYFGLMPSYPLETLIPAAVGMSAAATVAESLPVDVDDNFSVPVVAAITCLLLLPATQ